MKKFLCFVLVMVIFTGCIFSPNDSRINPYDPESPYFVPLFTNLQATTHDRNKSISVNWRNESEYADGFIVWKKLDRKFISVDTLRGNTIHIDSTQQYSLDLRYKVASFYEHNGKIKPQFSLITPEIDFGSVVQYSAFAANNGLIVRWLNGSFFDDLTILEYKEANSDKWQELLRIEQRTNKSFREHVELSNQKHYDFRVSLFLRNHKEKLQKFSEVEFSNN